MSTPNRRFVSKLQQDAEKSRFKSESRLYGKKTIYRKETKVSEPTVVNKPERLISDEDYEIAGSHIKMNRVKLRINHGESRFPDGEHLGEIKEKPWKNYFNRVEPDDGQKRS